MALRSLGLGRAGEWAEPRRTVPRAELAALWWALKLTKGLIWLDADRQIVYDGWHGFSEISGELRGRWNRVFSEARGRR
eukprot:1407459-Pyramimonas_sp.AAC.1